MKPNTNTIIDFILTKLDGRIENVKHIKTIVDSDLRFLRCYFTGKGEENVETHEFKLLNADEDNLKEWYEITHYDDSMDDESRAEVREESPIEKSLDEFYPQTFEIDGETYRLKWNIYDGDVVKKLL